MSLKAKLKDPKVLMLIGTAAIVCANLARYLFRHATSDELPDFVYGTFYGIGIPTLLLSVIRRKRSSNCA